MDLINQRFDKLEKMIELQGIFTKEVLNFNEAAIYMELSHSHMYKLTSGGQIPFYKPTGKKLYFKREELDNWLLRNRSASQAEIEQQASDYLLKNKKFR